MTRDTSQTTENDLKRRERYTHGYGRVLQGHAMRTADVQGEFFVPYLKPGMDLLDCGCGPGTITIGLTRAIAPGQAVGIDVEQKPSTSSAGPRIQ